MSRPICQSDPAYLRFCLEEAAFTRETLKIKSIRWNLFKAHTEFEFQVVWIARREEHTRRKRRDAAGLL